jgi:flagellar FliL protein
MIIIIVMAMLFIGVMGAGFFMLSKQIGAIAVPDAQVAQQEIPQEEEDIPGVMYSLKTFIVNLADSGQDRYIRVTMDLEVKDQESADNIEKMLPKVRDRILTILPTRSSADIQSSAGKTALRDEIISSLNNILKKDVVLNIYFTEFVIQ